MIANLEALITLSKMGTMGATATVLRISQSAVSKRIAALENQLNKSLIERDGRGVCLTSEGIYLLEKIAPLLADLKSVLSEEQIVTRGNITIGISESILSSWGANLLFEVCQEMTGVTFEHHTHRSPVVVEKVLSGEYMVGLCAGVKENCKDLIAEHVWNEPMVIIPAGLKESFQFPQQGTLPILTVEKKSATWESIQQKATTLRLEVEQTLESFFSVAQMACSGFGHGLVPIGIAKTLKIPPSKLYPIFQEGLTRPFSVVARKSIFNQPILLQFHHLLVEKMEQVSIEYDQFQYSLPK